MKGIAAVSNGSLASSNLGDSLAPYCYLQRNSAMKKSKTWCKLCWEGEATGIGNEGDETVGEKTKEEERR